MDRQDLQDGFGSKYFILFIMYIHVKNLLSLIFFAPWSVRDRLVCQGQSLFLPEPGACIRRGRRMPPCRMK